MIPKRHYGAASFLITKTENILRTTHVGVASRPILYVQGLCICMDVDGPRIRYSLAMQAFPCNGKNMWRVKHVMVLKYVQVFAYCIILLSEPRCSVAVGL